MAVKKSMYLFVGLENWMGGEILVITLRKITLDNRREVFRLKVTEEQQHYVASNLSSVASCYVLATNGGFPNLDDKIGAGYE